MAINRSTQQATIVIDSTIQPKHEKHADFQRMIWTIVAIVLVCTVSGVLLGSHLAMNRLSNGLNDQKSHEIQGRGHNPNSSDIITDTAGPLRIVFRNQWIAQPPDHELTPLELPSIRVIIAHTATENCTIQAACTYEVRLIQSFHIESRGWDDIAYNFLVGGDGAVYIGRGWDAQGAHTKGYNTKSICIAFIGTFSRYAPPTRQLDAAQKLIEEGVKLKKLIKNYALYGHRQLVSTDSPGVALYDIIKTWSHWSDEIN